MVVFLIILFLLLIFAAVLYYFFSVAFVKLNMGNFEDMDDPVNKPLQKHRDVIEKGIDYINNRPCEWVYTVSFDGLQLAARYFPNSSDKTIILFHGYRSSASRDFSCAIEMYIRFGFNVLLCDQRSHGRSEGRLITFGVKEKYDALSWTKFVIAKYGTEKIILDGISMGATTVLLACGLDLPPEVKGVIADCGFTSPIAIIKKVAKQSMKINASLILPFLNIYCKMFGKFSLYGSDTAEVMKKSKMPVLFIHGKDDGFVPCYMSEAAYNANKERRRLVLVDGADHGLSYLVDKELVEKELEEFLSKII